MSKLKRFMLVDGTALLFRMIHSPDLTNGVSNAGAPIKGPVGFFAELKSLNTKFRPHFLVVVFDHPKGSADRKKIYPKYKANRNPNKITSQNWWRDYVLAPQIKLTKQFCGDFSIKMFCSDKFEGDDVIATLACKHVSDEIEVMVVTTDGDLHYLLQDGHISIYDHYWGAVIDKDEFIYRHGYEPILVPDALAFIGDPSDNIFPVGGIGPITVTKLFEMAGGGINHVLKMAKVGGFPDKLNQLVERAVTHGKLLRNFKLTTLNCGVPICGGDDLEAFRFNGFCHTKYAAFFDALGWVEPENNY